jgi:hypothetical protein
MRFAALCSKRAALWLLFLMATVVVVLLGLTLGILLGLLFS